MGTMASEVDMDEGGAKEDSRMHAYVGRKDGAMWSCHENDRIVDRQR